MSVAMAQFWNGNNAASTISRLEFEITVNYTIRSTVTSRSIRCSQCIHLSTVATRHLVNLRTVTCYLWFVLPLTMFCLDILIGIAVCFRYSETEGFKIDTGGTFHGIALKSVTVRETCTFQTSHNSSCIKLFHKNHSYMWLTSRFGCIT